MLNATIGRLACVVVLGINALACTGSTEAPTTARTSRGTATTTSDSTATKDGDATSAATTDATKATTQTPTATPRPTTPATDDPMDPPAQIACTTATDSVTAAYNLALLRAPDAPGLSYYLLQLQAGMTRHQVLEALVGSPELASARAGLDDTHFVTSLYMGFLGRAPEPDGLAYWLGQLSSGVSRTATALSFVDGNEFANPQSNPVYACFY